MAEDRNAEGLMWFDPDFRGILPLDALHIPARLSRTIRSAPYIIRVDTSFDDVIAACAASRRGRESTWINREIETLYCQLHREGHAHSVEAWEGEKLVGGAYGVSLRGAFFGESMFSAKRDASKICLVHLVARLRAGGFELLDTQFITEHLRQFGAIEISRKEYHELLSTALAAEADFNQFASDSSPEAVLHSSTQTS